MNRLRKIIVSILLVLIIATLSTASHAFEVFQEDAQGIIENGHFKPNTKLPGGTFFCIEPGGEFHVSELMTKAENTSYPAGTYIPTDGSYVCVHPDCDTIDLPWKNDTKYYYVYSAGQIFSCYSYPDAAYVLAEMTERGSLISWDTAYGIWNSLISNPHRVGDYQIIGESQAYRTFFETIHGGLTSNDIFETLIKDNTNKDKVEVGVNQNEGSYTVGPFKIDYPDGVYDGKNKFSWINSIEAVTKTKSGEEILPVKILLSNGKEIDINDLKEKGNQTLDNKDFYIKFFSKEALSVGLKVEFGYLEHCQATMTEYTGTRMYRNWAEQKSGRHNHPYWVPNWVWEDDNGNGIEDDGEKKDKGHSEDDYYDKRRYQAYNQVGSATQRLMALSDTAQKVRKTVTKYFPGPTPTPPPPIDLTMELAGTVFIDQDTGKVNAGDNKLGAGEGLPGVEVYLRQSDGTLVNKTHTDKNGNYKFTKVNAQKNYYIEFVYNGMLYTNVERLAGNAVDISKATEEAQGHSGNRQAFNDQFKEISSYPQNYKGRRVYLQEEIADTFKKIAENYGAHDSDEKSLYAYDCRIHAYTTETYPLIKIFTIDEFNNVIAGKNYEAIYKPGGKYDQLHINLGIKARPTFDLALYKDVFNATLNINGKEEVYTYDARKDWKNEGFSYGVQEDYYLNQLREKYISGTDTNITIAETMNEGEYSHEYRTEEIINGNNVNENYQSWLKDSNYLKTLYGDDSNKQYAWRDINHGIADSEKLQIHVTYKIAIRNQSNVVGSVTEVVDYYDSHYKFEKAYVGDKDGKEIAETKVDTSETSMYGEATRLGANGQWTVGAEKRGYKTIYLRPTEKKLHSDDKEQYIYVTFGLINPEKTLIDAGLPQGKTFYTYNMAEINGYKTYGTDIKDTASLGLVDRDSNPGNFDPSTYKMGETALEDDTSRAPAYAYSIRTSRTIEGNVFEDALSKDATASEKQYVVDVKTTRFGNGTIEDSKIDKRIQGIKVELVEVKNGSLVSRQKTYTDENGWYGFGTFLPGDYTIRFTYGADDKTALTKTSQYSQEGKNEKSYNGQDYKSTTFTTKQGEIVTPYKYNVDKTLADIYEKNQKSGLANGEEMTVDVANQKILKYEDDYYWFDDEDMKGKSDAQDDSARRAQVNDYANSEYGKAIINHKAEVFNSYINQETLRKAEAENKNFDEFTQAQPMDENVDTETKNRDLVNELERRTYMYAYTPEINVEVEYTTKQIEGNLNKKKTADDKKDYYAYKITGVDFGVIERPRAQLTIDQDVKNIKVTLTDGTVLIDKENGIGKEYLLATQEGKIDVYDKNEKYNIILDDELLSGAKLEVTYNITVTNNSEAGIGKTKATNIINYVANNLNFDLSDNLDTNSKALWEVVKKDNIQTNLHSTFINDASVNDKKLIDLSTQTTILKASDTNPLITTNLEPKQKVSSTLTLKKTLSAESSSDDLTYSNMSEIVEISNEVGRYDHGAIPGNQSLEEQPREHDTSGASRYDETDKTKYPPDGPIIVTPPTGSIYIYYTLGIAAAVILAGGIFVIKKFVLDKNK